MSNWLKGPETRRPREARVRVWRSDERGSVTVLVVMSLTALLALLALGIDLGGLFAARSEAQRAADAAALAGASAFLESQESQVRQLALDRAMEFATNNEIRNASIRPEEVTVWVDTDSATVRAAVKRDGVSTWFAGLFGVDGVDVGAEATAWAAEAGAASCVKPFAVPDMWEETSDDLNGNRVWDEGERWRYDPSEGDRYVGYSGADGSDDETGYGGHWRDGRVDEMGRRYTRDYGRRITVKVTNPRDAYVSSFFLPWVLPSDSDQGECGMRQGNGGGNGGNGGNGNGNGGNGNGNGGNGNGGGSGNGGDGGDLGNPGNGGGRGGGFINWWEKREDLGNPESGGGGPASEPGTGTPDVGRDDGDGRGAARYRRNICTCNNSIIDLDTEYLIEPGNMVGPTYQGMQALIAEDPDAYWDEQTNTVVSRYGMDSPRVVTVSLFDPAEIQSPGRQYIRFNNFARVFLEEQAERQDPVTARFMFYVPGIGRSTSGSTTGSLVRVLQLIR